MKKDRQYITLLLLLFGVCNGFLAVAETDTAAISLVEEELQPKKIWFFIYVLDIDDIDGAGQNFAANVFVRLRWHDNQMAGKFSTPRYLPLKEVWHPTLLLANQVGMVRPSLAERVGVEPDGMVYYRQRYVGQFSQPLRLSDFPLDIHEFNIHFVLTEKSEDEVTFVPDATSEALEITGGGMSEILSLPDWQICEYAAKVLPLEIAGTSLRAPGFAFVFTAKRYFGFYFWQVVVPLVMIVLMSWAAFWVDPAETGAQIGFATSSILALLAYRFVLTTFLPKLPYMTRMDYYTTLCTFIVFLAFIEVVITSILAHSNRVKAGKRIDHISRILFPAVFVGLCIKIFFR
jgi:Neurotransmitter-gated ion-channel ligand binding domain/Neurotransmitter-gated ion-channel transmembrane region